MGLNKNDQVAIRHEANCSPDYWGAKGKVVEIVSTRAKVMLAERVETTTRRTLSEKEYDAENPDHQPQVEKYYGEDLIIGFEEEKKVERKLHKSAHGKQVVIFEQSDLEVTV